MRIGVHVCVNIFAHPCVCMYAFIFSCERDHMGVYVGMCWCVCASMCVYARVCVYVCMCFYGGG